MNVPVRTALPCHQAFNRLLEAEAADEICDERDDRIDWSWLVRCVGHATWVSSYIDSKQRQQLDDLYAEWRLQLAPRPFARNGEDAFELITPAVETNLMQRCEEGLAEYRTREYYAGHDPLRSDDYIEIAKEGIFDCTLRSSSPTFEIRRCLNCNQWFTPLRAGRARFCQDRCRSQFNNRKQSNISEKPGEFECAMCQKSRPIDGYSGLCQVAYDTPPSTDLEMTAYRSILDNPWCIGCVLEHRPQWSRYVTAVEPIRKMATR